MAVQVKKRKWIKWVILISIVVIIGGLVFASCKAASQFAKAQQKVAANSVLVERGDISVLVQASGSIRPLSTMTFYAPLNAQIREISVKNGDYVSEGDVLMSLSSDVLDDEIAALEAELSSLDMQILMADTSKSASILTPVSGRVKIIYAVSGKDVDTTMSSYDGLVVISADDKMELRFAPTASVAAGDAVTVVIGDQTVDATISTFSEGEAVIVLKDKSYEVDAAATVQSKDGMQIGSGSLIIHQPYIVIGDEGIISKVSVTLQQKVDTGDTILKLTESVYSSEYLSLLAERQNTLDQLAEKRALVQQLTVLASRDGVIENLMVEKGSSVMDGSAIFEIGGTDVFELVVAVDELDISRIKVGQPATIALDALSGSTYTAIVTRISSAGMFANGVTTYDVTIQLDAADQIMSGMSARADIQVGSQTNVLLVPVTAIKSVDNEKYVVVVPDPNSNEAIASEGVETKVTVGLINGSFAEILSGLTEGQYVQDLSVVESTGGLFGMGGQGPGNAEGTT
jgi:HlyD family secretion protein